MLPDKRLRRPLMPVAMQRRAHDRGAHASPLDVIRLGRSDIERTAHKSFFAKHRDQTFSDTPRLTLRRRVEHGNVAPHKSRMDIAHGSLLFRRRKAAASTAQI